MQDERSEAGSLGTIFQGGLAILDTGASRSVIGADLWLGVWKSLPTKVQEHVQEVPSKVGFRFGMFWQQPGDIQFQTGSHTNFCRKETDLDCH